MPVKMLTRWVLAPLLGLAVTARGESHEGVAKLGAGPVATRRATAPRDCLGVAATYKDETAFEKEYESQRRDLLAKDPEAAKDLGSAEFTLRGLREVYDQGKASPDPALRIQFQSLSFHEYASIRAYTQWGFRFLNPQLWAGTLAYPASVRLLCSALKKLPPADGQTWLYRGLDLKPQELAAYAPGKTVIHSGFASTSTDREIGEAFAKNALLKIRARSGRSIAPFSQTPHEAEVLLPEGCKLKVLSVETKDGITIVTAEEEAP